MTQRKGMGKGLGTGYQNILPKDSYIHALSAKGVKTYKTYRGVKFPKGYDKPFKPIYANCPNCGQMYDVTEGTKCPRCFQMLDAKGKTHVELIVQGNYGSGWEDVTAEEKYSEAHQRLKEYNENEPYPHRIIRRRVANLNAMATRKADFYRPLVLNGKELTHIIFYDKNGIVHDEPRGWLESAKGDIEQLEVSDNIQVKRKEDFSSKDGFMIAVPQDSIDKKYKTHKAKLYLPFVKEDWDTQFETDDMSPTYDWVYKVMTNTKTGAQFKEVVQKIPKPKNIKYENEIKELSTLMGQDNPIHYNIHKDKDKIKNKIKQMAKDIDAGLYAKSKEYIKGGMGDGTKNYDFSKRQMRMGAKVEMEHTNNPKIAQEISRDHLSEFSNYYTELAKAEKRMKKAN